MDKDKLANVDWGLVRRRLRDSRENLQFEACLDDSCDFLFQPQLSQSADAPEPPPQPGADQVHCTYVSRYKTKEQHSTFYRVVVGPEHCLIPNFLAVRVLNLSRNRLTAVPPEIGRLANLQVLNLSLNSPLDGLPREIGKLARLEVLNIAGTAVAELPVEAYNLVNINDFKPSSALRFPPALVCKQGWSAIVEHLRTQLTPGHRVASASLCDAWGPGLHPGNVTRDAAVFTVQARDRDRQKLVRGGDVFRLVVGRVTRSPSQFDGIDTRMVDNNDGTYTATYVAPEPGEYSISVKLEDDPISGSPFRVVVEQAEDVVYQFGSASSGLPQLVPRPCRLPTFAAGNIVQVACGSEHSLLLTDLGQVWSVGSSRYGQCGLGDVEETAAPLLTPLRDVVQVACGPFNSLALDSSGNVYSWGAGHKGPVRAPRLVAELERQRVSRVAAIASQNVAITTHGALWVWRRRPLSMCRGTRLPYDESAYVPHYEYHWAHLKVPIKEVCGGLDSMVVLTASGEVHQCVYPVGSIGKEEIWYHLDWLAKTPDGTSLPPVVQIAAGDKMNLALHADGSIRAWTSDDAGFRKPPQLRTVLPRSAVKVHQIACGKAHALCLFEDGALHSWGDGSFGQLGLGTTESQQAPRRVKAIAQHVFGVSASGNQSIVLTGLPRSMLGEMTLRLLRAGRHCDVTLALPDGTSVEAHRVVLAARCPPLARLFSSAARDTVSLPFRPAVLRALLDYLYGDRLPTSLNPDDATEMIKLATEYKLGRLRQFVSRDTVRLPDATLANDLAAAVGNPSFADFTLIVEGEPLPAHQVLLSKSDYFRVLLESGMKESTERVCLVESFDRATMLAFLHWLYTDALPDISVDGGIDLLQAANVYVSDGRLKDACTSLIIKAVDSDNVAYCYQVAKNAQAKRLEQFCYQMIAQSWADVRRSEGFASLSASAQAELAGACETT